MGNWNDEIGFLTLSPILNYANRLWFGFLGFIRAFKRHPIIGENTESIRSIKGLIDSGFRSNLANIYTKYELSLIFKVT